MELLVPALTVNLMLVLPLVGLSLHLLAVPRRYELAAGSALTLLYTMAACAVLAVVIP